MAESLEQFGIGEAEQPSVLGQVHWLRVDMLEQRACG